MQVFFAASQPNSKFLDLIRFCLIWNFLQNKAKYQAQSTKFWSSWLLKISLAQSEKLHTIYLLKWKCAALQNKTCRVQLTWKKKEDSVSHWYACTVKAQWEREILFLRNVSKNVLKRKIITFQIASDYKMTQNCIDFT